MNTIHIAEMTIDPDKYLIYRDEKSITLTRTEFRILYLLVSSNGKVFSRDEISKFVWGEGAKPISRVIDAHICNIRKKIAGVGGRDIITVLKGVGYRLHQQWIDVHSSPS